MTGIRRRSDVDMVIGAHLFPAFETGTIDVGPGLRAKGAGFFHIDITDRGGHGSRPDLVPNVLTIACDIYQHLISIPSNRFEAAHVCVITPGALRTGKNWNVLPDSAWPEGTIRFSNPEDGEILMDLIRSTAEGIAAVYGGETSVRSHFAAYPMMNCPAASVLGQTAASICGLTLLHNRLPLYQIIFRSFSRRFRDSFASLEAGLPEWEAAAFTMLRTLTLRKPP